MFTLYKCESVKSEGVDVLNVLETKMNDFSFVVFDLCFFFGINLAIGS
jgi:hypothetical protein